MALNIHSKGRNMETTITVKIEKIDEFTGQLLAIHEKGLISVVLGVKPREQFIGHTFILNGSWSQGGHYFVADSFMKESGLLE